MRNRSLLPLRLRAPTYLGAGLGIGGFLLGGAALAQAPEPGYVPLPAPAAPAPAVPPRVNQAVDDEVPGHSAAPAAAAGQVDVERVRRHLQPDFVPSPTAGQVPSGFVVRASLGGKTSLFVSDASATTVASSALQVGLFLGGKAGRTIVGLNIDYTSYINSPSGSAKMTTSSVLFTPELMIALRRSADQRVELVADFGLGGGALFSSATSSRTVFQLGYQLAPGVRFWAHPHFAVQGLAGFGGLAYFLTGPGSSGGTTSVHGLFAALGLLGAV